MQLYSRTHSDRLFQAALQDGRSAFIYTPLIEHKSWPDMGAPLQLMGYRHRIWSRYAQGEVERLRKLPPIITLLVYHGRPPWNVPTCLIDCIDADEDLLALQRDGRYTVKDLSGNAPVYEDFSDNPLLRAGLAALAWAFLRQIQPEQLARLLRDLPDEHPPNPADIDLHREGPHNDRRSIQARGALEGTMMRPGSGWRENRSASRA
ncbi:MAG: Rpn family recombination-promoting nuclease/putative transposase [Thioalkalivibrio sp.]